MALVRGGAVRCRPLPLPPGDHMMALSHCSFVAFSASRLAFFFGSLSLAMRSSSSSSWALSWPSKLD